MGRAEYLTFHVTPETPRQTLATAMRYWLKDQPWSRIRRRIQGRQVQVNGNLCVDESRPLTTQDVVRVWEHPLAKPPAQEDVRLLFVDEHVVVVEKPSGMTTLRHSEEKDWPRHRRDRQPTLDEILPRVLAARQRQNQPPEKRRSGPSSAGRRKGDPPTRRVSVGRVRAVHRLDRETSGVMIFARSPIAERVLVQMFRRHALHRVYHAIVHGRLPSLTIDTRLVRDRGDGRRGITLDPRQGQAAVTHVRPLEHLGEYTLVECRLETGRTHQIRIHLASRGNMVCGEKVYDKPLGKPKVNDRSGAPRLALHAAELGFTHPVTGKEYHFQSSLPPDLRRLRDRLRQG